MNELTKDSDFLICCAYKEYLDRRKNGMPKRKANTFDKTFKDSNKTLKSWLYDDYLFTISELKRASFVKMYFDGTFVINDYAITYMENRFKNNVLEIADFISKFI